MICHVRNMPPRDPVGYRLGLWLCVAIGWAVMLYASIELVKVLNWLGAYTWP